jgi:hypothetical protein
MMDYSKASTNCAASKKNDSFIIAPQATMMFYLQDTKYGGSWRVVQNLLRGTYGMLMKLLVMKYQRVWHFLTKMMSVLLLIFSILK